MSRPAEEPRPPADSPLPEDSRPLGEQRSARAIRGAFAVALGLEALTVLFVPRAIAQTGDGLTPLRLTMLLALAALLLLAASLQRRRAGLVLGSVLQLALIATGVLTPVMYVLGVIFGLVWLYLLRVRREFAGRIAG